MCNKHRAKWAPRLGSEIVPWGELIRRGRDWTGLYLGERMGRKWEETLPGSTPTSLDWHESSMLPKISSGHFERCLKTQLRILVPTATKQPIRGPLRWMACLSCSRRATSLVQYSRWMRPSTKWEPEVQKSFPKKWQDCQREEIFFSIAISQEARPEHSRKGRSMMENFKTQPFKEEKKPCKHKNCSFHYFNNF